MTPNPEDDSLENILGELIELEEPEQNQWLTDSNLPKEKISSLRRLLKHHAEDQTKSDFLEDLLFPVSEPKLKQEQTPNKDSFLSEASPTQSNSQIGPYQIIRQIGEGGMGKVFHAVHRKLEKDFAIKLLTKLGGRADSEVARFEREIKIAGKLDHSNLVTASDAGVIDGQNYLVMELVNGPSAQEIYSEIGRLSIEQACEIILQTAHGLQHAHQMDLVHRDIKPSNIMIHRNGIVKVVDFGLAALVQPDSSITGSHQILGTLDYMAPEQADSRQLSSPASDIYSLGATLYKFLSGSVPHQKEQPQNVFEKITTLCTEPAVKIENRIQGLPSDLASVVNQMLDKNPQNRPSIQQIIPLLEKYSGNYNLEDLVSGLSSGIAVSGHSLSSNESLCPGEEPTNLTVQYGNPSNTINRPSKKRKSAFFGSWAFSLLVPIVIMGAGLTIAWFWNPAEFKTRTNPDASYLTYQCTYKELFEQENEIVSNLVWLCYDLNLPPEESMIHIVYQSTDETTFFHSEMPIQLRILINQRTDLDKESLAKAAERRNLAAVTILEVAGRKVVFGKKRSDLTDEETKQLWSRLYKYASSLTSKGHLGFPTESFVFDQNSESFKDTESEIYFSIN